MCLSLARQGVPTSALCFMPKTGFAGFVTGKAGKSCLLRPFPKVSPAFTEASVQSVGERFRGGARNLPTEGLELRTGGGAKNAVFLPYFAKFPPTRTKISSDGGLDASNGGL